MNISSGLLCTKRLTLTTTPMEFQIPPECQTLVIKNVGSETFKFSIINEDPTDFYTFDIGEKEKFINISNGHIVVLEANNNTTIVEMLMWG